MFDLGYEVIVQPAILALTLLSALVVILRGFYRVPETIEDIEVQRTRFDSSKLKRAGVITVTGVLFILSVVVVPFGHRAVIWSAIGGVTDAERSPGLSFVVPIFQAPVITNVQEQRITTIDEEGKANAFVQSKELLEITIRATLIYRVTPTEASAVIDEIGADYDLWVESIFRDAIREVSGNHDAPDFAGKINLLGDEMSALIATQLEPRFNVITVNIEDAVLPPEFVLAVLAEENAEREADKQENLERAELANKNIRITAAEAAAEEARLEGLGERQRIEEIASSLGFTTAEYLQWLLYQRWDGKLPETLIGSAGQFDVLLNVK